MLISHSTKFDFLKHKIYRKWLYLTKCHWLQTLVIQYRRLFHSRHFHFYSSKSPVVTKNIYDVSVKIKFHHKPWQCDSEPTMNNSGPRPIAGAAKWKSASTHLIIVHLLTQVKMSSVKMSCCIKAHDETWQVKKQQRNANASVDNISWSFNSPSKEKWLTI